MHGAGQSTWTIDRSNMVDHRCLLSNLPNADGCVLDHLSLTTRHDRREHHDRNSKGNASLDYGASLSYGMLALFLALVMGGYRPLRIVERGGWTSLLVCRELVVRQQVCVEPEKISLLLRTVHSQRSSIVE